MAKRKIFILLVIIFTFLSLSVVVPIYLSLPAEFDNTGIHVFKIEYGDPVQKIMERLERERFIRSPLYAQIYVRIKGLKLQAGCYKLSRSMPLYEILNRLTLGTKALVKVTFPEGLTLKKTASILKQSKITNALKFIELAKDKTFLESIGIKAASAEGFLFPDTYYFGEREADDVILKTMVKTFFKKTEGIGMPSDFSALYEKVILASIIEREYQDPDEASLIAGVFANRLKIGMGLQSCATVEYIITELQDKKHPTRLFWDDLEINNPYNTYMYNGLPPGPISNPGLTALKAACNPENTDYLYFRLIDANSGKHIFSKTLKEHNRKGLLRLKKSAQ